MNNKSIFRKTLLAASIAMLTACGGSSTTPAGTTAAGTSSGVITGFGSIYMNGIEYFTDGATTSVDGVLSTETTLGVGDVCVLKGTINADGVTGVATSVICNDELQGAVVELPVTDTAGNVTSINVMGQTITINLDTVFDSDTTLTIADLVVGDIVEVSGFSDGSGNVLATRVETKAAGDDNELKGLVASLDETAQTFKVGALTIDYSSASSMPVLVNGLLVEVKTSSAITGDASAGFVMSASKIEIEEADDVDDKEGDEKEVQGMVTDITATSFKFNGKLVELASLELDGFDVTSLIANSMITVKGSVDANGNFIVQELEQDKVSENEAEGSVSAVTETTVTVTTLAGDVTLTVNNDTRMMDDKGTTPVFYFSLKNVVVGDFIEVEYYEDTTTLEKMATELERVDTPQ